MTPSPTTATPVETDAPRRPASPREHERGWWVMVLCCLAAALIFSYPVASTTWSNWSQYQFTHTYNQAVEAADPAELSQVLADAEAYNAGIDGLPILDPWLTQVKQDDAYRKYLDYLSQLASSDVMATVTIPAIDVHLPVYHGTEESTLAKGAGHLYGTDLPVGGTSRHAVLTAHTGIPTATFFDRLTELGPGDIIYVDVYGRRLAYSVAEVNKVLPGDPSLIKRREGRDLLTLVTCTPYGVNSHRLLVTAERTDLEEAQAQAPAEDGFHLLAGLHPWTLVAAAAALLALLAALVLYLRHRRALRRQARLVRDWEAQWGQALTSPGTTADTGSPEGPGSSTSTDDPTPPIPPTNTTGQP